MIDNLLSGAVGSVIGVIGAFLAASFAFHKTKAHERGLANHEHAIDISGRLAFSLVEFYEQVKLATGAEPDESEPVDITHLRPAERELGRDITVNGPLLREDLEERMKEVRDEMRELFVPERSTLTVGQLRVLKGSVRAAGQHLRDWRRGTIKNEERPWRRNGFAPRREVS